MDNGPHSLSDSLSSSSSSLSRQPSDSSSDFSELLNAWEAELDARQEARRATGSAGAAAGASTTTSSGGASTSGGATTGDGGSDGVAGASGGAAGSSSEGANGSCTGDGSATSAAGGSDAGAADGLPDRAQEAPRAAAAASPRLPTAASIRRPPAAAGGRRPSEASIQPVASCPAQRRPVTAGARGGAGGSCFASGGVPQRRSIAVESSSVATSIGSGQAAGLNGGGGGGTGNSQRRRRAAFVAGSVNMSSRKADTSGAPARDLLLHRLPAPALDLIVPALPPATRAALRCASKGLRTLVDTHTHSLTLRPDRRAAEGLSKRGTKAYALFPALRHVTVILAGSCSGAAGPTAAAAAAAAGSSTAPAANVVSSAGAGRRPSSAASSSSTGAAATTAAAAAASPLLPLAGWLPVCGMARCLTSLTMHLSEVALIEDMALSATHPHLQRLELFIGRSGNPHASPPVVQFMVGMLPGLRHLGMSWAGPPGGARGGGEVRRDWGIPSLTHGTRRLFLDGRPRLGPMMLAALGDLAKLESLELRGFLIDPDGHAMLARHWPLLAGRLQRLVLSKLHLMVPVDTPPGQQLGQLVGSCGRLTELHSELCLPATAGVPAAAAAGGPGGGGAAALQFSLMYAARDVQAVRPELLPASLTRLSLPGVCPTNADDLAALSRLRSLTSLEVTALGSGAGDYLTALQELRLMDCKWGQLLNMLPWKSSAQKQQQQPTCAVPSSAEQRPAAGAPRPAAPAAPAAGSIAAWPAHAQAGQAAGPPGMAGAGAAAAGVEGARGRGRGGGNSVRGSAATRTSDAADAEGGGGGPGAASTSVAACGQLRSLEVLVCERLDDWQAADRGLLARVGKGLLPLVDGGCKVRLKVADDAEPFMWNESDQDGMRWEPEAVWRQIRAAQNLRRLQAETKAVTERLERGRLLQAARQKDKECLFVRW